MNIRERCSRKDLKEILNCIWKEGKVAEEWRNCQIDLQKREESGSGKLQRDNAYGHRLQDICGNSKTKTRERVKRKKDTRQNANGIQRREKDDGSDLYLKRDNRDRDKERKG